MTEYEHNGLKPGAEYRTVMDEEEVLGTFQGYTVIGAETALVFEDDEGIIYIPSASITFMRLVKQAPKEGPESPRETYYG